MEVAIETAGEAQLPELLPLMRAYCDFYESAPTDEDLLGMARALLAGPATEGVQLIARRDGAAVGYATIFWTWSGTRGRRIGVMNDLFVAPEARGSGAAEALIAACRVRCAEHGAVDLVWTTAKDNHRAQAVYDRVGGVRDERWIDYSMPVD